MNHIIYLLLLLFFACSKTSKPGAKPVSERVLRAYDILSRHMMKCPDEGVAFRFYTCPSYLWPHILHNFVPVVKNLGALIRTRVGPDDALWFYFAKGLGMRIADYKVQQLREARDEAHSWMLLNRHLKIDPVGRSRIYDCLFITLDGITDLELEQVSMLPYDGDEDMFGAINELVNDRGKARLLDGLKRAARSHFEMDRMLRSLRRWLGRRPWDVLKGAIFSTAFEGSLKGITLEQLRAKAAMVPDFQREKRALHAVFELLFNLDNHLPRMADLGDRMLRRLPNFPGKGYLLEFLTVIGSDFGKYVSCISSIKGASVDFRASVDWDKVLTYNDCAMTGISLLPDEFFEEFAKMNMAENIHFAQLLHENGFPTIVGM